jgi:quercetin dioxygenase-like cupin family protein
MRSSRLDLMTRGWFVGDFMPAALRTEACEVAVKRYRAGDADALHHHRIAVEVTLVLAGDVRMLGQTWHAGDIIVLDPGEATAFDALTDAEVVVVKVPGEKADKYAGAPVEL